MAGIYFEARIDSDQLKKDIEQINRTLSNMTSNADKAGQQMDNMFRGLATSVAAYFSFDFAAQFITSIARVRGEFQQLEVAFETMLASKDKADKLMAQVVEFAAKTPFELKDVASGAKSLMAFGVTSEEIIPTLKALGDVSAGLSVPIERLILNFGQVKTQAQLTGRELRDFNIAGVPIVAELAKNLNRTEQEIQEMVTAGKIGFKEVSDAFRSMTDEGGRFANLMDKQAQTITGLQLNLRDAWNQMLNDIGKNSEGAIAGTIRAGISLVENYEKVISVIKTLVVTYGAYKAAVILINIAMKQQAAITAMVAASNGVFNRALAAQWVWTERLQKAQALLNKTMLNNPFVLAAMGIALLLKATADIGKNVKKTEEYIDELNESIETIGKQVETDKLIKKYEELSKETKLTKEQQDEFNTTLNKLGGIFPEIVTEVDSYGRVVKIAADELKRLNDEMRVNTVEITKVSLKDSQKQLDTLIKQREEIRRQINTGYTETADEYGVSYSVALSEKAILRLRGQFDGLNKDIASLSENIAKSESELNQLGKPEVDKILTPYRALFSEVTKMTESQARDAKEKLLSLVGTGLGEGAEAAIKKQVEAIDNYLKTPVNTDQIRELKAKLKEANKELEQVMSGGSRTSDKQREDARAKIKLLEKQLESFGIKAGKSAEDVRKAEEEKLKVLAELADREIELRNQTEAAKIAIMQDGADKQIKEAELAYKMELQAIEKYAADLLKTYNEAQKSKNLPTISTLPQQYQTQIDTQTTAAYQKYADTKVKIEKEAAAKIADLWRGVSDELLSAKDKELMDITRYYNDRIKMAEDAKDNELKMALEASKAIAERKVEAKYYIDRIDKEQDVALKTIDLQRDIYLSEADYEKKKFDTAVKYIQKKIDYLTKAGADINAEEIKQYVEQLKDLGQSFDTKNIDNVKRALVLQRNEIQKTISEYKKLGKSDEELEKLQKGLEEVNKAIFSINATKLQEIGQVFSGLGDVIGQVDDNLSSFGGIVSGIGQLFAGDARGMITLFTSLKDLSEESAQRQKELEQEQLTNLNNSLDAMNAIFDNLYNSIERTFGTERITRYNDAVQLLGYNLNSVIGSINNITSDSDLERIMKDIIGTTTSETGSGPRVRNLMSYSLQGLEEAIKKNEQLYNDLLIKYSESGTEEIKTLLNEYAGYVDKLYSLKDEYMQLVTSTTSSQIADSIIDGFAEGKRSMADFADDFEQLMNQALIAALKTNVLDVPLQKFYSDFAAAMDDSVLSTEERSALKDIYAQIIDSASQWAAGIKDLTGKDPFESALENKGMTGAVKSITEETAGLIAGQFMAMRTDMLGIHTDTTALKSYAAEMSNMALDQLAVVNQSVTYLAGIEKNTRDISLLRETNQKLNEMNTYLKNL